MRNIYIYLGSKSSLIADYALIKHPEKFSNEIKYNLAIGRAIKTNWGKKSLNILTSLLSSQCATEEELKGCLEDIFQRYNVSGSKALFEIGFTQSNEKNSIINNLASRKTISQQIAFTRFIDFVKQDSRLPVEIDSYIEKKGLEINLDLIAKWLEEAQKQNGNILQNLISYITNIENNRLDGEYIIYLSQAQVANQLPNVARDGFYKYVVLYGEKKGVNNWLSYVIGNVNKLSINHAFQLDGYNAQEVHPLINNEKAIRFFQNHDLFLDYYYTSLWKENLSIDYISRRELKRAQNRSIKRKTFRHTRILFVTNGNWNFLTHLMNELQIAGLELDAYDFSFFAKKASEDKQLISKLLYTPLHVLHKDKSFSARHLQDIDPSFYNKIQEADIVFCEWGNDTAVFLSRFLPPNKKLIIRLHSYEAFTHWHLSINMGGVDGLIFVADHIKNIFYKNASPSIYNCEDHCLASVIPNIKDFDKYTYDKSENARYTLGMAGFNKENKGLLKALKILKHLRNEDSRWALRLAGDGFINNTSEDYKYWTQKCQVFINQNGLEDAIIFDGYQNMPEWLRGVGFIISCSDREGTHEALLEGVSSGAIPIVIDWSMVRDFGGVKALYPFLKNYILDSELQIPSLTTQDLQYSFDKDRLELAAWMRKHSDKEKVTCEIIDFMERVYEA